MNKFELSSNWERSGTVSVWLGRFASEGDFESYMEEQYEDDDAPISRFAAEFGLGWYDHDFLEADFRSEPLPVEEFLSGNSYSSSFIADVVAAANRKVLESCNAKILLYDCAYESKTAPMSKTPKLSFIGAFPYAVDAPTARQQGG